MGQIWVTDAFLVCEGLFSMSMALAMPSSAAAQLHWDTVGAWRGGEVLFPSLPGCVQIQLG